MKSYKKFKLSRVSGMPVSNEDLLSDLKRVSELINTGDVTQNNYEQFGRYDCTTISRRFGSWNKAIKIAGLTVSNEINITEDRLFENLLILWQHYGRQPRRRELAKKPSTISQSPYNRRFGSWTNALRAFIEYANSSELESRESKSSDISKTQRMDKRDPSLRLRWKVLKRDHFTCCKCGASPAIKVGVELHVDHIVPYSRGGKTIFENLQTLCSHCNIGKSDL